MRLGPLPRIMTFLRVPGRLRRSFVGGIEIRREAFEFGRAGVDAIEDGAHAEFLAACCARRSRSVSMHRRSGVGDAEALGLREVSREASARARSRANSASKSIDLAGAARGTSGSIDGHLVDLFARIAVREREAEVAEAIRRGRDELVRNQIRVEGLRAELLCRFRGCGCPFPRASLKVRPIAITSPTDFICVPSVVSAPGNFSNAHLGILATT